MVHYRHGSGRNGRRWSGRQRMIAAAKLDHGLVGPILFFGQVEAILVDLCRIDCQHSFKF